MEPALPEVGVSWMLSRVRPAEGSGDRTESKAPGCAAGTSPGLSACSGKSAWGGVSAASWSWAGGGGRSGVTEEEEDAEGARGVWAGRSWFCPSEKASDSGCGSVEPSVESALGSCGMTSTDSTSSGVTVCKKNGRMV